eukprot:gene4353-6645_t
MWWSRISKPRIAVITTAAAVSGYCLHQRQVKLTSAAPVPSPSEFGASRFAARIDERGFGDSSTVDTDSLVIDPNSRLVHPRVVTEEQKYHELIAVGTRSVTFLGYYVYSAAVYVSQDQVKNIQSLVKSADSDPVSRSSIIDLLQDNRLSKVIRIAPYRKAALSHLRDGFGRALDGFARKEAQQDTNKLSQFSKDIQNFKQLFPKGNLNLGEDLQIFLRGDTVTLRHKDQVLGVITSSFIGKALIYSYLSQDSVIPYLRDDFWLRQDAV